MTRIDGYKRWFSVVAAIAVIMVDLWIVISRPIGGPPIAYGRLFIGALIQLIALGFFVAVRPRNEHASEASTSSIYYLISAAIKLLIPFLVSSWIGTSLVFSGLHEGNISLKYRGEK